MTLEEALEEIKDLKAKLAETEKAKDDEIEDAEKRASLTDAQRMHFKSLDKGEAKAFLAKSNAERDAVIAKALEADPVAVEFNGQTYRKSAGSAVIELAKAAKAQAEQLAKQADEIEKSEIRKAALEQLGGMPGDDDTHDYIVRSLRKGGGDAAMIAKATATLAGMKATSSIGKSAPGFGGDVVPAPAVVDLRKAVEEYQKLHGIAHYEVAFNKALSSDPKVRNLYEASRAER